MSKDRIRQNDFPRSPGIYRIRNKINDKCYYGSTNDLNERCYSHFLKLKNNNHENSVLQAAFLKYGSNSFAFETVKDLSHLANSPPKALLDEEQFYLDTMPCEYNIADIANAPAVMNRKVTERVNYITGEITKYVSASEAARQNGLGASNITTCANGLSDSCGGYWWKFRDEEFVDKQRKFAYRFYPVIGTSTTDGTTIHLKSYDDCAAHNLSFSHIQKCCKGLTSNRTHGGYSWRYENENLHSEAVTMTQPTFEEIKQKPVIRIDPSSGERKRYASQTLAEADGFSQSKISLCCQGENKTHQGYWWEFEGQPIQHDGKLVKFPSILRTYTDGSTAIYKAHADFQKLPGIELEEVLELCNAGGGAVGGSTWRFREPGAHRAAEIASGKKPMDSTKRAQACRSINLKTGAIRTYSSANEAASGNASKASKIREVCLGKRRTAFGCRWENVRQNGDVCVDVLSNEHSSTQT